MDRCKKLYKGVLLCFVIAVPAWFLGQMFEVVGGPVFAILIGMVAAVFWKEKGSFAPGITFTSKKVLQYAVILLGFGLNLGTVISVGKTSLPVIVATISTSLVVSFILCKLLKIPGKISVLVGVGSSICGGSAIAATAPVVEALKGLGLNAEASGRNDILVEGRKVSGTAQRVSHGRILHHGTLLFDSDPSMASGALNVDPAKYQPKGRQSSPCLHGLGL